MLIDDLATPCLLVEEERLAHNLRRMQQRADAQGARLRPHVKTHKAPALARRQVDEGAQGLTVATVGEAEAFFEAGFRDLRVAYTVVGKAKHERLARLMDEGAQLSFCVDTEDGTEAAADFYEKQERTADVLIEIDVGHGRCGVPWERTDEVEELARRVREAPSLRLRGLLTHAGQSYHGPASEGETPDDALRRASEQERERMLAVAERLGSRGLADSSDFEISIGSTPSMKHFENEVRAGFSVTEVRPGNYVFYDAMQVALGAAALEDCALTAYATVVSKRRSESGTERLYLDAGKKVLTTDTGYGLDGYGLLLYNAAAMRPLPHAAVARLSEEHGWVEVSGGAPFGTGDRLRLVPNHACVAVATQDRLHLVDGEDVVETWPVAARGYAGRQKAGG